MIVSRDAQVRVFLLVCNFCTLGCRVLGRPLFNYQLIMVKVLLPWFSNFPPINLRIQTTSCPNSFDILQHPLISARWDLRSVCLKYACYSATVLQFKIIISSSFLKRIQDGIAQKRIHRIRLFPIVRHYLSQILRQSFSCCCTEYCVPSSAVPLPYIGEIGVSSLSNFSSTKISYETSVRNSPAISNLLMKHDAAGSTLEVPYLCAWVN